MKARPGRPLPRPGDAPLDPRVARLRTGLVVFLLFVLVALVVVAEFRDSDWKLGGRANGSGETPVATADSPLADSLTFILAWSDPRVAGRLDSFSVLISALPQGGTSRILVNRTASEPTDSFRVSYPAPGGGLTFSATVRSFSRGLPGAPFGVVWRYPDAGAGIALRDGSDSTRWRVQFSPGPVSAQAAPTSPQTSVPAPPPQRGQRRRNQDRAQQDQPPPASPPVSSPAPNGGTPSAAGARCQNQPAGFASLAEVGWRDVPPRGEDVKGRWSVIARRDRFRVISDASVPQDSKQVMEGRFPQGSPGGSGPFRMEYGFERPVTAVYMCMWLKVSSNFTDNGNTGTKFGFLLTPYGGTNRFVNHYFNLSKRLGINLQSARATLNRLMQSSYPIARNLGEWHLVEWLTIANSLGNADGIARIWVDGRPVLSEQNVRYFFPDQTPSFTGVTWNPTYGGGRNPVPHDMFIWVGDWYISGR
jgi:hypothetical protein